MDKVSMNEVSMNEVSMNERSNDDLVQQYLKSLTSDQHKIIEIAKKQLGTSYDIKKSIGYLQFIKNLNH
jgi:hypothetical protein